MTEIEFLNLLARRESESLDFKRDPYHIVGATDEEKAKLVKDIVAFANAWRDGPAHILLGVDESQPNGPTVTGIPADDPLDDAMLQQLINQKLNRPLSFGYERLTVRGLCVGVIEIAQSTDRPLYLRKSFGGLLPDAVYIRRGSSTDIAKPEEVARMGQAEARSRTPKLAVEFAGFGDGRLIGPRALGRVSRLELPAVGTAERNAIEQRRHSERFAVFPWDRPLGGKKVDEEFVAMQQKLATCGVAFLVRNDGPTPARDVKIQFDMQRRSGFFVAGVEALPIGETRSGNAQAPTASMDVANFPAYSRVTMTVPKLHAGQRELLRYGLILQTNEPGTYPIRAQIGADELAKPQVSELVLVIECDTRFFVYNL